MKIVQWKAVVTLSSDQTPDTRYTQVNGYYAVFPPPPKKWPVSEVDGHIL